MYIYIRLPPPSPSPSATTFGFGVVGADSFSVNTKQHHYVRYKILRVMNMKVMILKDVVPSSLVGTK